MMKDKNAMFDIQFIYTYSGKFALLKMIFKDI